MTTDRLSGLALMNIRHEKPIDYDALVQLSAERYPEECFLLVPSLTKLRTEKRSNTVYFYHSFII